MSNTDLFILIFFGIFITVFIFGIALHFYDRSKGTHYSCNIFGWHDGSGSKKGFDGCSNTGTCSKCGKSVLQDSQGNWF